MGKVSLIIPCYNEAKSLPLLISRCGEVFKNTPVEVILVNNGSTDNSKKILSELTSQYPFMSVVTVEKNIGYGSGILAGLRVAKNDLLAWTHADMQTDPADILKGLVFLKTPKNNERVFVKGSRFGRPFLDVVFTVAMSFFETVFLQKVMWDINAQPTIFSRQFFETWKNPPEDFSLDLYAYYQAKVAGLTIKRFKVHFGERAHGVSHWNISWGAKMKFIKRTLIFSFELRKRLKSDA